MKLLLFSCFFLIVGFSTAFIPGVLFQFTDWSSITHRIITRSGLWATVVEFLKKNPGYANENQISETLLASLQMPGLFEGEIPHWLHGLVKSSKFEDAITEIELANVLVDIKESTLTASHVDAEQFVRSSRRLVSLKRNVIFLINEAGDNEDNYATARKEAGRFLHTLQDFYSHSNWVEIGNREPLDILGDKIIPERYIAGKDQKTCNDCTPASWLKLFFQTDDCHNNLILDTHKLTTGYTDVEDIGKPPNIGKCSHGGLFDGSREMPSTGGINKDSNSRSLSPHHKLHKVAASVAIKATKLFFDSIRKTVGDEKFARFLDMEAAHTISFAIDTTSSMTAEITAVQRATVEFIEDSTADDKMIFYYVLVPFNDQEFGPAYVTRDPDMAKSHVNHSLKVTGSSKQCAALGMSGLYLALTRSLPNSDIFYFSDASAKDAHLAFSILSMALEKQCRIYFLISGTCPDEKKRRKLLGRVLYGSLATNTGGQLLEFTKSDIDDIMKIFWRAKGFQTDLSLTLHQVLLLAVEVKRRPKAKKIDKVYALKSDSSIVSMTMVLTADGNANIEVIPPQDYDQNEIVITITELPTVYSVRVIHPVVGNWKLHITASGSFTLQVTAQSTLAFSTSLQHEILTSASKRVLAPIPGNPIKRRKLLVTVVPSQQNVLLSEKNLTVYVLDAAGSKLESFDVEHGQLSHNNSYYGSVLNKFDSFKLMYTGYSKTGEIIQRVLPRLIKPQEFEIKVRQEHSDLIISPNETTSFNVTLHNYGPKQRFSILVSDVRSFVTSFKPKSVTLNNNASVDIQVELLAPNNTKDGTTSSISISASLSSEIGSTHDPANFISLGVTVFSKEFQFLNETELEATHLTQFLIPQRTDDTPNDSDGSLSQWAFMVLVIAGILGFLVLGLMLVVLARIRRSAPWIGGGATFLGKIKLA